MNKSKGFYKGTGNYRKVTITLSKDQEVILDSLRRSILDSGGKSLGRTEVIRAAIELIKMLKIDPAQINDEREALRSL